MADGHGAAITAEIIEGDCLVVMAAMAADSVDAIVTDPPYHLTTGKKGGSGMASLNPNSPAGRAVIGTGFMGKAWDGGDIAQSVELWREAYRVLKPGGHLVAFGGTRTSHRMVCAIEDAGFEIRDSVMWIYGSGFPKSHNVSKQIDKAAGAEREVVEEGPTVRRIRPGADQNKDGTWEKLQDRTYTHAVTAPATPEAAQWEGWGTALKPAHEPICVARKPLAGTVAENVQRHGTGAINIDGCRVEHVGDDDLAASLAKNPGRTDKVTSGVYGADRPQQSVNRDGRWPANIIHDGSEEVLDAFARFGERTSGVPGVRRKAHETNAMSGRLGQTGAVETGYADSGTAARFFYCAKASKADRDEGLADFAEQPYVQFQTANGTSGKASSISDGRDTRYRNTHPTVKPTALMRYLCRLVTPPGGLILDPFAGSGSTGKAAIAEGFRFIGIEREAEYVEIARARVRGVAAPAQGSLFA